MSSRNAACLVSGLTISGGEKVVGIIIGKPNHMFAPRDTYLPLTFPFIGVYDDEQGCVKDIKESFMLKQSKRWLGEDVFDTTYNGDNNMYLVMMLKDIYDKLTETNHEEGIRKLLEYDDNDLLQLSYGYNLKRLLPTTDKLTLNDHVMLSRFYCLRGVMYNLQKAFVPMHANANQVENYEDLQSLNKIVDIYINKKLKEQEKD